MGRRRRGQPGKRRAKKSRLEPRRIAQGCDPDPRKALGYIRVSTDEQYLSPEAQRADIEAYCAARGLRLMAVVEDRISGKVAPSCRPAWPGLFALMVEH